MFRRMALVYLAAALVLAGAGFARAEEADARKFQTSFFGTFDTIIILQGYAAEDAIFDRAAQGVRERFERYHAVFDAYNAHPGVNNLYHLNREGPTGQPIPVEPELMDLLLFCRDHQPDMRGKVNVAMGAVLQLWHDYREAGIASPQSAQLPPMPVLRDAAAHIRFEDLQLDEAAGTVTFLDPQLRLDVGAVAKGYATERVAQWLLAGEMPSFLLSAGGNVRVGRQPMDGRQRWGISIQDPDATVFSGANENYLDILFVTDTSVVTSGDYQRFYVVEGKRYHHLIDPGTLMPSEAARSVTIVCEDSGLADMLSTAVFLMDFEAGYAFVEGLEGVECLWMLADGRIELSSGLSTMSYMHGTGSARD